MTWLVTMAGELMIVCFGRVMIVKKSGIRGMTEVMLGRMMMVKWT